MIRVLSSHWKYQLRYGEWKSKWCSVKLIFLFEEGGKGKDELRDDAWQVGQVFVGCDLIFKIPA